MVNVTEEFYCQRIFEANSIKSQIRKVKVSNEKACFAVTNDLLFKPD